MSRLTIWPLRSTSVVLGTPWQTTLSIEVLSTYGKPYWPLLAGRACSSSTIMRSTKSLISIVLRPCSGSWSSAANTCASRRPDSASNAISCGCLIIVMSGPPGRQRLRLHPGCPQFAGDDVLEAQRGVHLAQHADPDPEGGLGVDRTAGDGAGTAQLVVQGVIDVDDAHGRSWRNGYMKHICSVYPPQARIVQSTWVAK